MSIGIITGRVCCAYTFSLDYLQTASMFYRLTGCFFCSSFSSWRIGSIWSSLC